MSWEQRQNGGWYYTRSRKVNGRIVREYVGGGLVGQLSAELDDEERAQREETRRQRQSEREMLDELEQMASSCLDTVRGQVKSELTAAGYHQHKRGEWRRKRG